jgi:DNA repair protein RecN (Recombination protein N)
MLKTLDIQNYALIESLHLEFDAGMSVITGETGAGKSILLGALSLILGQRASLEVVRNPEVKCVIEGTFSIGSYGLESFFQQNELDFAPESILRREILPSGKSRAFINDTPVQLQQLKDLGELLVDVHSQHRTLTLNASDVQLALLDEYAGQESAVDEYSRLFDQYVRRSGILEALRDAENRFRQERDYHQFLFDELSAVALVPGETESHEAELGTIRHSEAIQEALFYCLNNLTETEDNLDVRLKEMVHRLREAGQHLKQAEELASRMESLRIEARDVASELLRLKESSWPDPSRATWLEERLDMIYRLQKKHGVNDDQGLLNVHRHLTEFLEEGVSREEEIRGLERELAGIEAELTNKALALRKGREAQKNKLSSHMLELLHRLGMPDAAFDILIEHTKKPGRRGTEAVRFLFSANKGGKPTDLVQVASGGERSRLMLAIKSCITQRNVLPTLIFDEIDSGVSGEMAHKVGQMMSEMGDRMQVIAITHLPQIAAKGKKHYLVFKESDHQNTYTRVTPLNPEERVLEVGRLLSGDEPSESALHTAQELLTGKRIFQIN